MSDDKIKKERKSEALSRRDFLVRAGATGAAIAGGIAGASLLWQPEHFIPGFQEEKGLQLPDFSLKTSGPVDMAIAHGVNVDDVVKTVLGELGGMERFIKPGDVVVIKPNVAFDRPAALAATTHPETLSAVAKAVRGAGASEILIADNPINSPAGCFLKSGIKKVANELDLTLVYPEQASFSPLSMDGEILRRWTFFHKPFRRADKVIGLAPCKDHNLCHASMTMKNWYGLLGGRRNQFHQHIHSIVSDFALMVKPTLVILDGMRVLKSNGPTGGRLSDVKVMNTIVAGTDMVAVDSWGYEFLLERNLDELEYLHKAYARGLGNINWKELNWKETQV